MNMDFTSKSAVVVCHDIVHGIPHEVRDYLLKKHALRVLFISHPYQTAHNPIVESSYSLYEFGVLQKRGHFIRMRLPEFIAYLKDSFVTLFWSVYVLKGRVDYFIGAGNLNAFCGIILMRIGIVKKTIYYVIDYVPVRFKNKIVNRFYHYLEMLCARYATSTWNLTPRMIKAREQRWGVKFPHQIVVPHGVHLSRRSAGHLTVFNPFEIAYLGFLTKEQGVQLAIEALPQLAGRFKKVCLIVIGSGYYEGTLKKIAHEYGVTSRVHFLGFSDDQKYIISRLSKSAIGLALYTSDHPFSFYADQSKIKQYLLAGIPVITTKVPYVAKELVKKGCGYVIPYTKNALVTLLTSLMKDSKKICRARLLARHMAESYNWDNLFDQAFQKV